MATQALATQNGHTNGNGKNHHIDIQGLLTLVGPLTNTRPRHWKDAKLPFPVLNVLTQVRRTFEDIGELALNIAQENLMNRLLVGRFTTEHGVRQYLLVLNFLWGTAHRFEDLVARTENGNPVWYILIAGERRKRSFEYLWEMGCTECQERHGKETPGKCFWRHFRSRNKEIPVRVRTDMGPIEMVRNQFKENTHLPVPPHEEAEGYHRFFRLLRLIDPALTLTAFSRIVGKGEERIRNALRFCDLPEFVREAVKARELPYGAAVQLARLKEVGTTDAELSWWVKRCVLERRKVEEVTDRVTQVVKAKKRSGQGSLLEIMTGEQTKVAHQTQMRKVVARESIQAVWMWIHYIDIVFRYLEEGKLDRKESPFSLKSPVRVFRALVVRQRNLLPLLQRHLSQTESNLCEQVLDQAEELLPLVESAASEEGTAHELGMLTLPAFANASG